MKRIEWIDIAKGIGIILVTVGHTNLRHLFGDYVGWWINAFHMPLFFVMAGLCFDAERYPRFLGYLGRKLRALGWPYVSLTVFMALVSVACYWGHDPAWSLVGQLKVLLTLGSRINTFWFVKALFEVEILYWVIARGVGAAVGKGKKAEIGVSAIAVALAAVGAFCLSEGAQPLLGNVVLVSLFYYGLGHQLRRHTGRELKLGPVVSVATALIVAYSVLVGLFYHHTAGYWGCVLGNKFVFFPLSLMGIAGVAFVSMALQRVKPVAKILVWCGVNSIVFMAIHGHCGIFRQSWVACGFGGLPSVAVEYGLFAVLAWALAGPLKRVVRL